MGLFGKTCGIGSLYKSVKNSSLNTIFFTSSLSSLAPKSSLISTSSLGPKILYEDQYILAVEKPAGVASVPAEYIPESKTIQGMVRRWADLNEKGFKPYLLHRLDKNTSGVILFGKHEHDRKKLEGILRQNDTRKTYLALVKGVPKFENSTIKIPLDARTADIKVPAITHYKILKKFGPTSLLEVEIETGRKHQIRKHLAMIKNPLVLDPEYGDRLFNNSYQRKLKGKGQFFLRAWKIEFIHPFTKEKIKIEAPENLANPPLSS